MRKALVVGFGVSGKACAAFLQTQGFQVLAVDRKAREISPEPGIELQIDAPEVSLEGISLVVVSPGVAPSHPILQRAEALKIETVGEIEWAFRSIQNRAVGITGTNGKTTTALLTAHLLNEAGRKAKAVGNNGVALSSYAIDPDPEDILVIELSSFQLETIHSKKLDAKKLDAGVLLNITPDHLDRYPDLRAYAAAKGRMQACLKSNAPFFVADAVIAAYRDLFEQPLPFEREISEKSSPLEAIQKGLPEKQNIDAAIALSKAMGLTEEECAKGMQTFRKPPHRIEWVAKKKGVHYYNDSKGTNIDAVMHAMALFPGSVVLVLGGVDKGASYAPWIEAFQGKVKQMVAYGQAAPKMEQELSRFFPFVRVEKMVEAIQTAHLLAKEGDHVLFSPGCSSFDQFLNYAHRGDEFKRIVREVL
jgi:UDP-N-acetylmuramoylalanine--D-glutamate ligase